MQCAASSETHTIRRRGEQLETSIHFPLSLSLSRSLGYGDRYSNRKENCACLSADSTATQAAQQKRSTTAQSRHRQE